MNKINFRKVAHDVKTFTVKHGPEILTGLGIAGMFTSIVLAVTETPKAMQLKKEAEEEKGDKLTAWETVKACWKPYAPAAALSMASAGCLIGANNVHLKRYSALTAAYKLSESAFTEYREKVTETLGEKKEQAVREKIAEDKVKNQPVKNAEVFVTERGNTVFLEPISGRHFKSDFDKIGRVQANLNNRIATDPFGVGISLNEFYTELGLNTTQLGDQLGWSLNIGQLDIGFIPQIDEDEDGNRTQVVVLDYRIPPRYGYDKA